jgi:multidrug resistance efflux pump
MSRIHDALVRAGQDSEKLSCIRPSDGLHTPRKEEDQHALIAASLELRGLHHFHKHPFARITLFAVLLIAVFASATVYWNNNYRRTLGISESTVFEGTMRPAAEVKVTALTPGVIRMVNAHVGDSVNVGDVLAKMDSQEAEFAVSRAQLAYDFAQQQVVKLRGELAKAEADVSDTSRAASLIPSRQVRDSVQHAQAVYEQTLADYQRSQELYNDGIIAKQVFENSATALHIAKDDLENARGENSVNEQLQQLQHHKSELLAQVSRQEQDQQLKEARVALQAASVQLANTEIRASSSGVISVVTVKAGDQVSVGAALVVISRIDRITVNVPVTSDIISSLHKFQKAQVRLPTMPPRQVLGIVRSISPVPDANMTHSVEVEFENPMSELLAGQPAEVRFVFQ